jgi:Na+/H+ antiporter NhaD/arsenite permease-like protein
MLLSNWIFAGVAVAATVVRPRSWTSVLFAAGCAVAGGGALGAAFAASGPAVAFLLVVVAVAAGLVRLGVPSGTAGLLLRVSREPVVVYVLICAATAVATALLSLDGAVVLLVPVTLELARRGFALRPLLLGGVAVANAFSLALPEGNPTNLVVLARLHEGIVAYAERGLPAGTAAAVVCAVAVALVDPPRLERRDFERPGPTAGVGAVLRLGVQLTALLALLIPLAGRTGVPRVHGLAGSLAVAATVAVAAGLANNLPVSAAVAALLAGPAAYAALAGVSVGALLTENGSVATMLAGDLAGEPAYDRRLVPAVGVALAVATALLVL